MDAIKAEEEKLLQTAEGLPDNTAVGQLTGEAKADGFDDNTVRALVSKVLKRMKKQDSGKNGGAFGVAHNPVDRCNAIRETVGQLHGW